MKHYFDIELIVLIET